MTPILSKVLAVSNDPDLLANTSAFLTAVGYEVHCCRNINEAAGWIRIYRPEVVLADARNGSGLTASVLDDLEGASANTKTLLWTDDESGSDLTRLAEAGADDMVEYGAWGELLARLHAVGRLCEFERRLADDCGLNPLTHLPTLDSFQEKLQRCWERQEVGGLLILQLNVAPARKQLGVQSWADAQETAARVLRSVSPCPLAITADEDGVYQVLLARATPTGDTICPATLAEEIRQRFEDTTLKIPGESIPLTVSVGVADAQAHDSIEAMARTASEAAAEGTRRGGNCVINEDQRMHHAEAWRQVANEARLYEGTTAKHLMAPLPWSLRHDESLRRARTLFADTMAAFLPVTDENGAYQGLLRADQIEGNLSRHVGEVCCNDCCVVETDTTFEELLTELGTHGVLVVTNNEQPVGLVDVMRVSSLGALYETEEIDPRARGTSRLLVP